MSGGKFGNPKFDCVSEDEIQIECIGADRLKHVYRPHENKTICGVDILRKKLLKNDRIDHFCCYECTY